MSVLIAAAYRRFLRAWTGLQRVLAVEDAAPLLQRGLWNAATAASAAAAPLGSDLSSKKGGKEAGLSFADVVLFKQQLEIGGKEERAAVTRHFLAGCHSPQVRSEPRACGTCRRTAPTGARRVGLPQSTADL